MTIEAKTPRAARGRRIRLGMVGGGEGAFIGGVHRIAARLDDHYELVAGALVVRAPRRRGAPGSRSASPKTAATPTTRRWRRPRRRARDGIEAVAIVTPNHLHAPVAEAFLKAGIHVICDKPLATTREGSAPPRGAGARSTGACSR